MIDEELMREHRIWRTVECAEYISIPENIKLDEIIKKIEKVKKNLSTNNISDYRVKLDAYRRQYDGDKSRQAIEIHYKRTYTDEEMQQMLDIVIAKEQAKEARKVARQTEKKRLQYEKLKEELGENT